MAKKEYSSELCKELEQVANHPVLEIRHRPVRYENGTVLPVEITGVFPAITGKAELMVDKFLGADPLSRFVKRSLRRPACAYPSPL